MKQAHSSSNTQNSSSSNKKWLVSLAPPIALGVIAIAFWGRPAAQPIIFQTAAITAQIPVLPLSATFVVGSTSHEKPFTARGRLTASDPHIIAAPAAGMVARLLVQPGQIVKAGNTIAMISNQAVPAVEKSRIALQQNAASAQETATRQQNILQGKLAQEKVLLQAANQRVDKAAKQLSHSRDLLRRLQNGEKIPKSEINDLDSNEISNSTAPTPINSAPPKNSDHTAELAQAQQEADQTAKIAAQKWQDLHVLLTRQSASKSVTPNVNSTANSNTAQPPTPTQDQIDAARVDAKNAQDAADKARIKVFKLSTANTVPVAQKSKITQPANSTKSTFITEADATRIANAALQESKDALAQVDAIQKQIRRYQSPVQSANANFQAATSNLENAQRTLFDNPPKVPMTPVVANAGGMIQKLATLAMQVNPGDEIASVVAPNLLNLDVRDSNGLWKNLKVNSKFTVMVQTSSDPQSGVPTDARLVSITPPPRTGKPSILHIQVFNPIANSAEKAAPIMPQSKTARKTTKPYSRQRVFSPDMIAICSLPRAGAKIIIPRSALHLSTNKNYDVAVLKPLHPNEAKSQDCSIQWNNVIIKNNDGKSADVVISSGINQGDRISLQPEMLYNLTQAKGSFATVKVSNS